MGSGKTCGKKDIYVQTYLVSKIESIRSAIQRSCEALLPSSSHATYLAFYFSFQSRFDYWLATNYLIYTDPLAASMDEFLRRKLCDIAGFDIFSPQPGVQVPDFTERRVSLKVKNGGLGFRPLSNRFLALNSLNNTKRMWLLKGCGTRYRAYLVWDPSTSRTGTIAGLLSLPLEPLSDMTPQLLSHAFKTNMRQLQRRWRRHPSSRHAFSLFLPLLLVLG